LQVIVNMVEFGFTIQEAIDAPRVHHQWLPDELRVEDRGFPEDVIRALEVRGHRLAYRGFMGDAEGIMLDPKSGIRLGAADPRGDGLAMGY
jgi:gamma-glutamyltranspeptidase/glutathione hydrolase